MESIQSIYKNAKLIDKIKEGRCVMQVDTITFEKAGLSGERQADWIILLGTGKEEGNG